MTPGTGAQSKGKKAENTALAYLVREGLTLERRNFRCRGGEIDLIMRDAAYWVFIEVRYRRSSRFGAPQATVDRRKQQRLILAARHFLAGRAESPCRFDVVAISGEEPIMWIKNAFDTPP